MLFSDEIQKILINIILIANHLSFKLSLQYDLSQQRFSSKLYALVLRIQGVA